MNLLIGGNAYGYGNIGDDAALAGIVTALQRHGSGHGDLAIESKDGALPWLKTPHTDVRAGDWTAFRRALEEADVFIVGGGTTIGSELNLQYPLLHIARRVALASLLKKKTVFWGCGANRIGNQEARRIASAIVRAAALHLCRDRESQDAVVDLGAEASSSAFFADPAYLVTPEKTNRTAQAIERIRAAGNCTVGVNLLNETWHSDAGYKKAVASALDFVHMRTGAVPVFFTNEIRTGAFYDIEANLDCAGRLRCPSVSLYPEYYSPGEMLEILSAFDAVFSMRMHALILASSAGIPFDGISRIDKVDNFFAQFGRKACCGIGDATPDAIANAILSCLASKRKADEGTVSELRSRAVACGNAFFNLIGEKRPMRCPLEILRYAPGVSPARKLPAYLSFGPRGVAEFLRRR